MGPPYCWWEMLGSKNPIDVDLGEGGAGRLERDDIRALDLTGWKMLLPFGIYPDTWA